VIPRLLQRDHRGGAAGVAHVHALDLCAAAETGDQMGVEARREPSRARRGGDEVRSSGVQPARASVARRPIPPGASAPSQNRALSSSTVSFGVKRAGIDPEVTALDVAGREEPAPALVRIPGERQDLRLRVTIGGTAVATAAMRGVI